MPSCARRRLVDHEAHVGQHAGEHRCGRRCRRRRGRAGRAIGLQQHAGAASTAALPSRAVNQNVLPLPSSLSTPTLAAHQLGEALGDRQAQPGAAVFAAWSRCRPAGRPGTGARSAPRSRPMPVSRTAKWRQRPSASPPARATLTTTSPCSVNLTALLQKLIRIWPSRSGSPTEGGHRGSMSKISSSPLAAAFSDDQVGDPLEHLVEIELDVLDGELAGLDLREIEDVVDDAEQMLAGLLDLAAVVALSRRRARS